MPNISQYATIHYRKKIFCFLIFLSLLECAQICRGMDDSHFYRARTWPGETHSNKDGLRSFDATFMGGSTQTSRDAHGDKAPLLALYGPEDLSLLGIKTSGTGRENISLSYTGNFSLFETQFQGYFNFTHGFFTHIHLPVRSLELCDIRPQSNDRIKDLTSWNAITKELEQILANHQISTTAIKKTGMGDLSILVGWSWTTYDSRALDFFDTTLQTGVLFPTGKKKTPYALFDIPTGYGHFGFPVIADISAGILGWLTFGTHLESRFFLNADEYIRPPTKQNQPGILRLGAPQKVRVHSGPLWNMDVYIKADHCIRGFSFVLAYSHDQKQKNFVEFISSCSGPCDANAVNLYKNDPFLRKWNMNVLHALIEYDWANEDNMYGPRIGLEYNYIISGKNIFNTSTVAGHFGLDCEWSF